MGRNMKILVELGEEKDWNTGDTFGAASWVPPQVSWLWGQQGWGLGRDGKAWELLNGEGCNSPHNKG